MNETIQQKQQAGGVPTTDFGRVLGDLNAGVFEQQVNRALTDIAANVCTHNKKGELVLRFRLQQIGNSHQVVVKHDIKSVIPQPRGRITEEHESETPMHVGRGGELTLFPANQDDMFK